MNVAERKALHSAIWKIADELRGSVDGWDFKQYVLGMLFYRFISESLESYINEAEVQALLTLSLATIRQRTQRMKSSAKKAFLSCLVSFFQISSKTLINTKKT